MFFDRNQKEFCQIKSNAEIEEACEKIFFNVLGEQAVRVDRKGQKYIEKYATLRLEGINPDCEVYERYLAKESEDTTLCVILLVKNREKLFPITKFYINFYKIEDEDEDVFLYDQALVVSGKDSCIIGFGRADEIASIERTLRENTPQEDDKNRKFSVKNKNSVGMISLSVLTLLTGVSVAYVLRSKNIF